MLKKSITYENPFTGESVTEEHYFHISKADLVEMELEEHKDAYITKAGEHVTGMQAKLQRIVDSEDGKAIIVEFKDIIRRSYGKKDGDRFLKSKAIWEEFDGSEAYSQFLFDLLTNAEASAEFIQGVIPNNLEVIASEIRAQAEVLEKEEQGASAKLAAVASPEKPVMLSPSEVAEMDPAELKSGLAEGRYKLS